MRGVDRRELCTVPWVPRLRRQFYSPRLVWTAPVGQGVFDGAAGFFAFGVQVMCTTYECGTIGRWP